MNTFRISSRVDCAIQINFNLDTVDKGGSCYIGNDLSIRVKVLALVNST